MTKYLAINLLPCNVVEDIFIRAGGGTDVVNLSSITAADFPVLRRVLIDGGEGVDVINGTQVGDTVEDGFDDVVSTGGGDDAIEGGAQIVAGDGNDLMVGPRGPADGGAGDDRFEEPAGEGPFSGGPGMDAVMYNLPPNLTADIRLSPEDGGLAVVNPPPAPSGVIPWSSIERAELFMFNGGTQTIDASRFSGVLEADGRGGPDIIIGGPNEDFLTGGPGNDDITGGPGFDWVNGGLDADQLQLRDGEIDRGVCGDGADLAIADPIDSLLGCESISLPAAADTTAPDTTGLKGPKQVTKGKVVTFKFSSTEAGSSFKCKVDGGKTTTCASPFKVKTGKLKPGKHTFSAFAVDAAGNADATPATQKFTVKAAKPKPRKQAGHKRRI